MKVSHTLLTTVAFVSLASTANAALFDRGNGMIYDSSLNITWMQDANYVAVSTAGALLTWDQANTWATDLVYGGVSGWRLPSAKLIGDSSFTYDGSTDVGYNNTRNEIGHLFNELGIPTAFDTQGNYQLGSADFGSVVVDPLNPAVSFLNLQNTVYWESEASAQVPGDYWAYNTDGSQDHQPGSFVSSAWAVHTGDIAAVPVPTTVWLFGSSLLGLVGAARKRKIT